MNVQRLITLFALVLLAATPLAAQKPKVLAEQIPCLPGEDQNGVVNATIENELGGTVTKLYFRWEEDEDFYYVFMTAVGGGRYWGVPPRPKPENEAVEYYVAVMDPVGNVVARSESLQAPVEGDCKVELTEQQRGTAENLVVGETTAEQRGEEVTGFKCFGVVTRVGHDGVVRGDEVCRACVIAWWEKPIIVLPAAGGVIAGGILLSHESPPEASPATP